MVRIRRCQRCGPGSIPGWRNPQSICACLNLCGHMLMCFGTLSMWVRFWRTHTILYYYSISAVLAIGRVFAFSLDKFNNGNASLILQMKQHVQCKSLGLGGSFNVIVRCVTSCFLPLAGQTQCFTGLTSIVGLQRLAIAFVVYTSFTAIHLLPSIRSAQMVERLTLNQSSGRGFNSHIGCSIFRFEVQRAIQLLYVANVPLFRLS